MGVPVEWVIAVPAIPPESLKDNFAVPGIGHRPPSGVPLGDAIENRHPLKAPSFWKSGLLPRSFGVTKSATANDDPEARRSELVEACAVTMKSLRTPQQHLIERLRQSGD
jgi:hypothetical protein